MANEQRLIDANAACERCRMKSAGNCGRCIIGTAPTVDAAEVVHAEWRIDGFCTNCHYRADVQSIGFNCTGGTRIEYKRTKFCPECGAKMDGERRRISEADLRTEG